MTYATTMNQKEKISGISIIYFSVWYHPPTQAKTSVQSHDILYKMSPGHSVNHVVGLDTKPGLNGPPATCLPALCHLVSSNFGPKCLAQFSSQSEVMAEVVDERLPLFRIDVVIAQDEVAANVNLENADLDCCSASELAQSRLSLVQMNLADDCLKLSRTLIHPRRAA